jgi:MIP family channel proteins
LRFLANFLCSNCRKECFSEFIGTYLLVLIGPASIILAPLIPNISVAQVLFAIALTFGGIVGILIVVLGEHSGAVFNPAITLGAVFGKTLQTRYFVPYLFFQILGGLSAGLSLRVVFLSLSAGTDLGSTKLATSINPVLGIAIEASGTFVLTFSALLASDRIKKRTYQALLVGMTLFLLILLIGPYTGAGFNPARSLGPAVASGYLENLYVYLVGPVLGASFAGLIFRGMRIARSKGTNLNIVCLC